METSGSYRTEMGDLPITVDENNYEIGTREILKNIRSNWNKDLIKFKVS